MSEISRISRLLWQPRAEWRRIDEEAAGIGRTVVRTLLPLAAVPAVGAALGLCLLGYQVNGAVVRLPRMAGLELGLSLYLLLVIGLMLVAWVTATVAPTFGGRADRTRGFKLAVHGATAALLGGVFLLFPALWPLAVLAGLYSGWTVFVGLPVVMRCTPRRSAAYTAVVVLAGAVLGLLASETLAHFRTVGLTHASSGELAGRTTLDGTLQAAKASGLGINSPAAPGALSAGATPGAAAAADVGSGTVPATALKAALPETLGSFTRKAIQMQGGRVGDREASNARADYVSGEQRLRVELTDLGNMRRLMAEAGAVVQGERENAAEAERTWQQSGRILRESYRKDGSLAQVTTTLRNGVVVDITGQRMGLDEVKAAAVGIDLGALETLRRHTP